MRYADAGVNIAVADDAKNRIRHLATRTFTNGVLGGIGSFGALFELDVKKYKEPILVSSADGVGTKLKVAIALNVHSTVGGDLVNHCVNDILVQGAEPLFFLDYLALGKMDPHVVEQLVDGMSRACRKAGCLDADAGGLLRLVEAGGHGRSEARRCRGASRLVEF